MINGLPVAPPVATARRRVPFKQAENVSLHVPEVVRVPGKVEKIIGQRAVAVLLLQQVRLVEKEDEGNVSKGGVVDERGEDITGLEDAIGLPVFQQNLVVLAGGGQEEDAVDRLEALVPFLALESLPSCRKSDESLVCYLHESFSAKSFLMLNHP